ncbi:MAG: helix-turn-helix transcriptional regulator [Sandaracinaceae bacterium]|nr:MAG: XRE family transcriptional regulator [Sandaracinaceae bacterium]
MSAATTQTTVTLFTDRSLFEQQWKQALSSAGLAGAPARPDQLPDHLERGAAVVIDAGASSYDEDELLAHVGLARALGACPIVSVPSDIDVGAIDDILDDLCAGLVARRPEDVGRIVAALARRTDAGRARRFEYLTVSPRGGELLAIFSDGNAVLVERDHIEEDDGTDIEEISLEDEATRAVLTLESGSTIELTAATVARKSLLAGANNGSTNGQVDGVKLGQRIRELRLAAGLTQAELARRTGIHRPNIARVEAGRHTPSLETIARLANAIGVPTTRVLEG